MSGIGEALQDKAVFAHVPTYGVKVFNRDTGQEIPVDESTLPAPTHEFIAQLKPLVKQRQMERETVRRERIATALNDLWDSEILHSPQV